MSAKVWGLKNFKLNPEWPWAMRGADDTHPSRLNGKLDNPIAMTGTLSEIVYKDMIKSIDHQKTDDHIKDPNHSDTEGERYRFLQKESSIDVD